MRTIAVIEPGKVEVVDIPEPTPGPYQVRVKTEVACLCNATDGKLVAGHFPGVNDYPLVLGHESAGIVDSMGDKVRNFQIGDRVIGGLLFEFGDPKYATGWGGFCEYTLANDHDAMVADAQAGSLTGYSRRDRNTVIHMGFSPDCPDRDFFRKYFETVSSPGPRR